jgi:hypothetical protein
MKYRYASFNRPLWIGFDPGTPYQIVEIQESDKLNGRKPHDVIETEIPISNEKKYSLELTDYQELAEQNKLIEYASSLFKDRWLDCIVHSIRNKTIVSTEQINKYLKESKE